MRDSYGTRVNVEITTECVIMNFEWVGRLTTPTDGGKRCGRRTRGE